MTRRIVALLLSFLLAACAANPAFHEARDLIESGDIERVEQGLARLEATVKENPQDAEARNYFLRQRAVIVQRFLAGGDNARAAGAFDQAEDAYRRVLRIEPGNARAKTGIAELDKDRRYRTALIEAQDALKRGDTDAAYAKAKAVLAGSPTSREAQAIVRRVDEQKVKAAHVSPELDAKLKKKVTLELRDAPLRSVFELMSQRTGLNFVFDKDLPPELKATVFVRDTPIEEALRMVLMTNQLDRKVLNDNTLLIYPNTAAKARDYKDLLVRSFYLANADAKQTANMIRSLVKTRDLYVDEKLNLLVIRDTPEAVRIAEKLIANQDMSEPEVMMEVEVLEVSHTQLEQLGIQWPGSVGVSLVGAAGTAGQATLNEVRRLNAGLFRISVPDPLLAFNFAKQAGRSNVLANPRIRVKNKEKARIHIGDKVPVITTTAGSTGFVSEAVNYLDVGLKLEVEPTVHLEDEVGIKVGLEVSNIARQVTSPSGTVAYQVGTRNAATTLRLRDGETQVLAGLINDEDRRTASGIPGLMDMPGLGRLFSNNNDTVNKTEIVLLITPRVVRNLVRPEAKMEEFSSGTETEIGGGASGGAPAALPFPAEPRREPQEPPQPPQQQQPQQPGAPGQDKQQ